MRNKEYEYAPTAEDPNLPTVSIELEEDWNSSYPQPVNKPSWTANSDASQFEPTSLVDSTESKDFEVKVAPTSDENNKMWKAQVILNKKDKERDEKSVIMHIGKQRPSYLDDVEVTPFFEGNIIFAVLTRKAYAKKKASFSSVLSCTLSMIFLYLPLIK